MRRRDFLAILGGSTTWALVSQAQEPGRTYRLGTLSPSPRRLNHIEMLKELGRSGFIEGRNLIVDFRPYGQRVEQITDLAAELVKAQPDVIFAGGDFAIRAVQKATSTIPIVSITDDMLGAGLVDSLARPGGNTTGISLLATELDGKRQDILIEAVPGIRRMAALADTSTTGVQQLQALQAAARHRGVDLSVHRIAKSEEIAAAIDAAKTSNAAALNILASPLLFANRQVIVERAIQLRLPAIYQWPEWAEEGGLIAYGPRLVQLYREVAAQQIIKIMRGAKPADLPVQQPTKFELVINLQTAKAINLEIPAGLVLRADKLIE
jgi:putative tryptophan/tyrosine transport system substrate-binding protein